MDIKIGSQFLSGDAFAFGLSYHLEPPWCDPKGARRNHHTGEHEAGSDWKEPQVLALKFPTLSTTTASPIHSGFICRVFRWQKGPFRLVTRLNSSPLDFKYLGFVAPSPGHGDKNPIVIP